MTFNIEPYLSHVFVHAIDGIRPNGTEDHHGHFLLNDVDELFLLSATIDAFIDQFNLTQNNPCKMKKLNKPQKSKRKNQDEPIPGYCYVLEGYLKGWAPADAPGSGTVLKTSQEIADELEDMVDIDTFTLASIMSQLGFRAHYDAAGPHGWMMRRDPSAIHTIRPAVPEDDPEDD